MTGTSLLVSGLVEPPDPEGGPAAAPSTQKQGMDFWINDLWFKVDATQTDPYQRATAQFRKDQLDNAAGFGDASLVGYWTRGQFSFHSGEGIRYYDVIGSQTLRVQQDDSQVLNRYWDGGGVDPFTPGAVTLMGAPQAYTPTYTHLTYAGWVGSNLLVIDSGVAKYGNATTMTAIGSPSTTTAACTSATTAFIATMNSGTAQIETLDLGTGTRTVIYTNGANQINYLFYAKDRLWAIDSTQTVYQLPANPGTSRAIAGSDKVFQASTAAASSQWSVADTPGAVMLSNGNLVYAATPDTSGAIPTMNWPFTAATLPVGEMVYGMAYSLNALVLATSAGIRVAELTGQSGNGLAFGPLLMKQAGPGGVTTITGVSGSTVFAVVGGAAYRVNLAQQVGTTGLEFAYTRVGDQTVAYAGAATTATNYALFSSTKLYQIAASGGPLATGYIETGFHRFQTLENKKFQTIQVRAKGTGGTIKISYQLPNGTTNSLYTMDLAQQQSAKLNLNLSQPQELLGFRFDIAPSTLDPTVGPTLLGYQVQALPAPTRNRMIRVPLLCYDVERREAAPATGHTGWAWERLSALEDMESSGGTFQFCDYRTGETGEAFIESVEFKGGTSPSAKGEGYGGVLYLTLRKLA